MSTLRRRDFLARAAMAAATGYTASLQKATAGPAAPQKKQPIMVGQIGTKHAHASGKLAAMRKLADQYDVIGVVEPDSQQRERLGKHRTYQDIPWLTEEQLLNAKGLQAVAVETEVKHLVPTGQRCLEAGLHIHLDKPAGESLADLELLHSTASQRGLTVQMGYMFRYNPAFQFVYQAVRKGWLGEVFELHGVMSKKIGDAARKKYTIYPGGTMFELGCHLIDSVVKVLGKPQVVTPHIRRSRPDEVADNMLAVFDYRNATATIRSSVIEPQGNRRRQFVVVGTEGVARILPLEPPRMEVVFEKPHGALKAGLQSVTLPKMTGRYDGEFLNLAEVLRGEKPFDWDAEHDLAAHEAILRASGLPVDT